MHLQDMDQNSFFDVIDHEAIKSLGDAHHLNCLSNNNITPKTT